ncbi:hypothetical protein [Faecalibacillus intestinalis]|uniref:hypothetical protein n=1 Tax=Faecalibacillus intestinalis TaxID=1982626 RepID=UPI00295F4AD4|nr:hypothetical protein [Faecalibacillus intestinalis]
MPNLDEFDLDPVVSTAENGNDGNSPKSYSVTTKPCLVTDVISELSQESTSLSTNPGYTESKC